MPVVNLSQLPEFLGRLQRVMPEAIKQAFVELMQQILEKTQQRTPFSFQQWEFNIVTAGGTTYLAVKLPFESPNKQIPYTSNIWNNPYFAGQLPQIYQPLQEALTELGLKHNPALGEPIKPVSWPHPPNTIVVLDVRDLWEKVYATVQANLEEMVGNA